MPEHDLMADSTSKNPIIAMVASVVVIAAILLYQCALIRRVADDVSEIKRDLNADVTYEYDVIAIPDAEWDSKGKALGAAGWEIITARRASGADDTFAYECIVKRRSK